MNAAPRTPALRLSRMKASARVSGLPERPHRQPDLADATHPSDEPKQAGRGQRRAAAIGGDDRAVDGFGPPREAGHPTLRRQPMRPSDEHAKHAVVLDRARTRRSPPQRRRPRSGAPRPTVAASCDFPAASSTTPAMTNTAWVAEPTVMSTTMVAVACAPETPR